MIDYLIPEPFQFNPLKHHLGFICTFIACTADKNEISHRIRHVGGSVMDIYSGNLTISQVLDEIRGFLISQNLESKLNFKEWAGITYSDYRVISLSDGSEWALKYHDDHDRYVHLFPARSGAHSFRVKANTLKSAILFIAAVGKDYISVDDLNTARAIAGLSPVKDVMESAAISEMIEILRTRQESV